MKHTPSKRPKALTVAQVCDETGFSENYVRLLIQRKELAAVRAGRAIRILAEDLDSFLLARREPTRDELLRMGAGQPAETGR